MFWPIFSSSLSPSQRYFYFHNSFLFCIFQSFFKEREIHMWPIHLLTIDMVVTNCFYSIVYDDNICGNKVTSIFAFFSVPTPLSRLFTVSMLGIRFEIEPFIAMFDARKFTFLFVFSWQLAIKLNSITDFTNKVIQKTTSGTTVWRTWGTLQWVHWQ